MSASPPTQSTKRPLEETSSPSRTDQPDAKRPALDKVLRGEEEEIKQSPISENGHAASTELPALPEAPKDESKTNGEKIEAKDAQGETVVPVVKSEEAVGQPIVSTQSGTAQLPPASSSAATHDETAWIHVRAVITSPEAATIIGKGGENVSKIRQMSNAKCTVSDYQKGAIERILTVSGSVDAVAKVCNQ